MSKCPKWNITACSYHAQFLSTIVFILSSVPQMYITFNSSKWPAIKVNPFRCSVVVKNINVHFSTFKQSMDSARKCQWIISSNSDKKMTPLKQLMSSGYNSKTPWITQYFYTTYMIIWISCTIITCHNLKSNNSPASYVHVI